MPPPTHLVIVFTVILRSARSGTGASGNAARDLPWFCGHLAPCFGVGASKELRVRRSTTQGTRSRDGKRCGVCRHATGGTKFDRMCRRRQQVEQHARGAEFQAYDKLEQNLLCQEINTSKTTIVHTSPCLLKARYPPSAPPPCAPPPSAPRCTTSFHECGTNFDPSTSTCETEPLTNPPRHTGSPRRPHS